MNLVIMEDEKLGVLWFKKKNCFTFLSFCLISVRDICPSVCVCGCVFVCVNE